MHLSLVRKSPNISVKLIIDDIDSEPRQIAQIWL